MKERKCYYCDSTEDLRPYGPDGSLVCYECGVDPEHEEETKRNFLRKLDAAVEAGSGLAELTDEGPVPFGGARK